MINSSYSSELKINSFVVHKDDNDLLKTKQAWIILYLLKGNDLYVKFPKKLRRSSAMNHYKKFKKSRQYVKIIMR